MTGKIIGNRFYLDGEEVPEEKFWAAFPPPVSTGGSHGLCGWKPLVSDALAVHGAQVEEAQNDSIAKGVPTEFTQAGQPIFRTRAHRKKYMQAYGFFDRQGGYGDAQPGQTRRDIPDLPNLRELY